MDNKEQENVQQEVLNGWKDIARYLGKGVRTVQRYERQLGLPVRRPSGYRAGSVLALKDDLDSWLRSSPTLQEPIIRSTQIIQEHLRGELRKGLRERLELQAQMAALRKELETSIRSVRESISKLRQQLDETSRRQESIASTIRSYSKARASFFVNGSPPKPS